MHDLHGDLDYINQHIIWIFLRHVCTYIDRLSCMHMYYQQYTYAIVYSRNLRETLRTFKLQASSFVDKPDCQPTGRQIIGLMIDDL